MRILSAILFWLGLVVLLLVLFYFVRSPGFSTLDVSYSSQGAEMQATLYMPDVEPAPKSGWPAVFVVSGSAPFPRAFYDVYARRLVQSGYAVLLPDKRGAGESGGDFVADNNGSRKNLTLLAQDVVSSVEFLANHPAIHTDQIGVLGVSQAHGVTCGEMMKLSL